MAGRFCFYIWIKVFKKNGMSALQIFQRLSSTNFTRSILEYFVPYISCHLYVKTHGYTIQLHRYTMLTIFLASTLQQFPYLFSHFCLHVFYSSVIMNIVSTPRKMGGGGGVGNKILQPGVDHFLNF